MADVSGMAIKARDAARITVRGLDHLERERASFHLLRPRRPDAGLSASAEDGVAYLQFIAGDEDERASRILVSMSLRRSAPNSVPFVRPPAISVLNRRRRAARMWVNAILDGDVSPGTLRALTSSWLPQLAGTGPEAWRAIGAGRTFIEFLRGLFTGAVMSEPMANLIRHAKALHALETILAIHLGAILSIPVPRQTVH